MENPRSAEHLMLNSLCLNGPKTGLRGRIFYVCWMKVNYSEVWKKCWKNKQTHYSAALLYFFCNDKVSLTKITLTGLYRFMIWSVTYTRFMCVCLWIFFISTDTRSASTHKSWTLWDSCYRKENKQRKEIQSYVSLTSLYLFHLYSVLKLWVCVEFWFGLVFFSCMFRLLLFKKQLYEKYCLALRLKVSFMCIVCKNYKSSCNQYFKQYQV